MNPMSKTVINARIGKPAIWYTLNAGLGLEGTKQIGMLQQLLAQQFGDVLWLVPPDDLHITLMDWLVDAEYGRDKRQLRPAYEAALLEVLRGMGPIEVRFDTIASYPAAIIVRGQDDGQFQRIRQGFLDRVQLLPGTKPPPDIIHFTLARFAKTHELKPIEDLAARQTIALIEPVSSFRLIRERKIPMVEYNIIKEYPLVKTNRPV